MGKQPVKAKLLIVVPTLICGGLEKNVSIICNNIDSNIYDVTLAVLNNENQFFNITNKEVQVIDMQIKNVRKSLFALLKLAKQLRPDIILATANHLNLLFAIFKFLFPSNIKIIARESSIISINSRYAKLPALYNRLLKIFYKNLDFIVCQSAYMQQDLVKHYNVPVSKTTIIYNPVEAPAINSLARHTGSTAELITVARLSREKGLERLIKAVSFLKIPYRFNIIGEGNMRLALEGLIKELSLEQKVFLKGEHDQPFSLIPGADLFLMGSYYEGFPNALLEATAAGIPVVAFNAPGGIGEVLKDRVNGFLVNSERIEQFSKAIEDALQFDFDKEAIKNLTVNRFNINVIMQEWERLFRSFLPQR